MSEDPPAWRSDLYLAILHADEPRVLMLPGDAGWGLPHAALEGRFQLDRGCAAIIATARRQLGVEATVLDLVEATVDWVARRVEAVYALEQRGPGWAPPPGARWASHQELAGLEFARPGHRAAVERWLLALERGDVSPGYRPWTRPGWFAAAAAWVEAELARLGHAPTGPVEQVKAWGLSCVLRVPTGGGEIYFKAVPAPADQAREDAGRGAGRRGLPLLFVDEPVLLRALAPGHPDLIPRPLAIDGGRHWMLLPALGRPLAEEEDRGAAAAVLARVARLQVAVAGQLDALFAAGCLDRRLAVLATQIGPLLDALEAVERLDKAERDRVRASGPLLRELCARLAGYAVPETLVHGDLHPHNVARGPGGPAGWLVFDWTDACVAHPYFDLVTFLHEALGPEDPPETWARLRDAYLEPWAEYEPPERLAAAFALAQPLGALHLAVSYRHLMANLSPAWQQDLWGATAYWLRIMLRTLPAQPAQPA